MSKFIAVVEQNFKAVNFGFHAVKSYQMIQRNFEVEGKLEN